MTKRDAIAVLMDAFGCDEEKARTVLAEVRMADGKRGGRPRRKPNFQTATVGENRFKTGFGEMFPCLISGSGSGSEEQGRINEKPVSEPVSDIASQLTPPRGRPKTDQRVNDAMGWFRKAWEAKYREKWLPEPGAINHVRSLMRSVDAMEDPAAELEKLPKTIERYLADTDPFVVSRRHQVRYMVTNINRYRLAPRPSATESYLPRLG